MNLKQEGPQETAASQQVCRILPCMCLSLQAQLTYPCPLARATLKAQNLTETTPVYVLTSVGGWKGGG